MQVPGNEVLDFVIEELDDAATNDIITPTVRKEAGEALTDEEIERQSGLTPPTGTETDEDEKPAREPKASEYKQSAESIVLAVDFAFQTAVPFVFDFKAFSADERRFISQNQRIFKKRKRNEDRGKQEAFEFFDVEANEELYQRWAAIQDYLEDEMQLEEQEVEKLTVAWQRVLEFYKKQPGPWPNLIMALTATYGKRTSSIFVV